MAIESPRATGKRAIKGGALTLVYFQRLCPSLFHILKIIVMVTKTGRSIYLCEAHHYNCMHSVSMCGGG